MLKDFCFVQGIVSQPSLPPHRWYITVAKACVVLLPSKLSSFKSKLSMAASTKVQVSSVSTGLIPCET